MKLNRILCPIDYSPYSRAANFYASLFAEASGAAIIYVNVADPPAGNSNVEDQLDDAYLALSTNTRPFVHELTHSFEVRVGDPAKGILDVAAERTVDLIVLGTHGRTGASQLLHGSVCKNVLRDASCPVMAVKSSLKTDWMLPGKQKQAGVDKDHSIGTNVDDAKLD